VPAAEDCRASWVNTTHDWAATVDVEHLASIRDRPTVMAPGGALHLVLEVLAYAADEAEVRGGGTSHVTLGADGSISVADDGRGTDTRLDEDGRPVRKPIMATKDLRFFDAPDAQLLPDGHPRRGMSAVAALSDRLVHHNRRHDGAWSQEYRDGLSVTDLVPVEADTTTGTTVTFWPTSSVEPSISTLEVTPQALGVWPCLTVTLIDHRTN